MPKRNSSQVLGDIGESEVILLLQRFGWTANKIQSDYGEDVDCNVFINGQRTNLYFRCQVKSCIKENYVRKLKSGDYSVSIKASTVELWLSTPFPVFLVIYNENTNELFWGNPTKQFLSDISKLSSGKISIRISSTSKLTIDSKEIILNDIQEFYNKL